MAVLAWLPQDKLLWIAMYRRFGLVIAASEGRCRGACPWLGGRGWRAAGRVPTLDDGEGSGETGLYYDRGLSSREDQLVNLCRHVELTAVLRRFRRIRPPACGQPRSLDGRTL